MAGPASIFVILMGNVGGRAANARLSTGCLAASMALGGVAGLALLAPRRGVVLGRIRAREPLVPLLVAGGSGLLMFSLTWSQSFRQYWLAGGSGRIVRKAMANYRAPFYGVAREPESPWAWIAVALAVALAFYLARDWLGRGPAEKRSGSRAWVGVLVIFQIVFAAALALSEDRDRLFGHFATYAGFAGDAMHFEGPLDLLRRYVEKMPGLSGYGRHYPPGIALVIASGHSLGAPVLAKVGLMIVPALTTLPLLALARELGLDEGAARMSAALFATSASVLAFATLAPTSVLLLPATMAVWMLVRGLSRDPLWAGVGLGLSVAVFTLFSFGAYLIALPMGCLLSGALVTGRASVWRASALLGSSIAVFFAFFLALELLAGFSLFACLDEAFRLWWRLYDGAWEYGLRGSGSLLAYLWAIGFPLSVLAIAALRGVSREAAPALLPLFAWSVMLGLLLGAFSGRIYLEGERILLFYTPLVAIPAGWELARRQREEAGWTPIRVLAIALAFACAYGLLSQQHLWAPYRLDRGTGGAARRSESILHSQAERDPLDVLQILDGPQVVALEGQDDVGGGVEVDAAPHAIGELGVAVAGPQAQAHAVPHARLDRRETGAEQDERLDPVLPEGQVAPRVGGHHEGLHLEVEHVTESVLEDLALEAVEPFDLDLGRRVAVASVPTPTLEAEAVLQRDVDAARDASKR